MAEEIIICPCCNEYPQHGADMLCTNCAAPLGKPKLRRVKARRINPINVSPKEPPSDR